MSNNITSIQKVIESLNPQNDLWMEHSKNKGRYFSYRIDEYVKTQITDEKDPL